MIRRRLLVCVALPWAAALCSQAWAQSFNVENAAAVEGLFRGVVMRCADEDFARRFIKLSESIVAFSLQGDGPIDLKAIEASISRHSNDLRFDNLNKAKMCSDMLPKLEALYENRLAALQEAQRATEALRELNNDGRLQ